MKKTIFIFTLAGLFGSSSPMHRTLKHPCLPLEFYKHTFGWIVRDAQAHPKLKEILLKFIYERNIHLKHFEPGSGEYYARSRELPIPPGEHALRMNLASKRKGVDSLYHYGCLSGDMIRFAIRKNLGVEEARDKKWQNRLLTLEPWPMKEVSEEEELTVWKQTYANRDVLKPAIVIEEKAAHMVMKHFLNNPQVIQEKHVAFLKN